MTLLYYPKIFTVADIDHAKSVILTNEGEGADTDTRWAVETPYVLELISHAIDLRPDMVVLDYGCGIGRLAKGLIDASGCSVIGVDISAGMRTLATDYVGSDRFLSLSPEQFDVLVRAGMRADAFISVWVLQHCFAPAEDIARIHRGLRPDGRGFVMNMWQRAVPAVSAEGMSGGNDFAWALDQIDVATLLRDRFIVIEEGSPDASRMPNMAVSGAFWMSLKV